MACRRTLIGTAAGISILYKFLNSLQIVFPEIISAVSFYIFDARSLTFMVSKRLFLFGLINCYSLLPHIYLIVYMTNKPLLIKCDAFYQKMKARYLENGLKIMIYEETIYLKIVS